MFAQTIVALMLLMNWTPLRNAINLLRISMLSVCRRAYSIRTRFFTRYTLDDAFEVARRAVIVLFDSFGAKRFQEFLIDNRADIVEKFFPNAYTYTNAGDLLYNSKIDMQALVFRADKFLSLTKAQLGKLTSTMQCLGLFFAYFAADKNLDRLNIYVVIDELQDINTDICGIFALHFLHSIYYPQDNDSCNTPSCTISTIKNILNESFHEGSESGSNLNTLIIKQFQKRYMK